MSRAPVELLQSYRREQILEAAKTVISENGYAQSSVDQIAKRAKLSRSTVYEYFSSKDEILKGCLALRREVLAEELAARVDCAVGLEAQLAEFFEVCLSRVDQNREFFLAVAFNLPVDEAAATKGPGGNELALVFNDFNDAVGKILADGVESGELTDPVSPENLACLGTLVVGAMGARCRLETPPPTAESAATFASFALRGLAQ